MRKTRHRLVNYGLAVLICVGRDTCGHATLLLQEQETHGRQAVPEGVEQVASCNRVLSVFQAPYEAGEGSRTPDLLFTRGTFRGRSIVSESAKFES